MAKYIPGQLLDELTKSMEPIQGISWCYEKGLLQGDYVVARQLHPKLGPKIEKIRQAAYHHWQEEIFDLKEIFQWVKSGGKDPLTNELTIKSNTSKAAALALIDNDIFIRPFERDNVNSEIIEEVYIDSIV